MKYYLVRVWGDIEPKVLGPYESYEARFEAAKQIRSNPSNDDDGLYMLDIDEQGVPDMNAFSGGAFLTQE